jgi:hypothetical protein
MWTYMTPFTSATQNSKLKTNKMKPITTQQIIKFNALLRNLNLEEEDKRELIYNFTNKRSDRTNDMHFDEAKEMIAHLAERAGEIPAPLSPRRGAGGEVTQRLARMDKMRKKVIHIAYQLNWTRPNGKCDYDRINNFIKTHPIGKRAGITCLNDYNYEELVQLVNQFQSMYNKQLEQFK